jgi:hypothetical protein
MTSHRTPARDAAIAIARPVRALAALLLIVLALPVAATEANHPGTPGATSQPRPLTIGLVCEGSASPLKELHGWDPRVPVTDSPEQCLDAHTKRRITPSSVALEYNPATESLAVVLTVSEPDRAAINNLFTAALMSGKRRDLILVDGKVVVSRYVASLFQGPTLLIGMRSDEDARAVAAVLSGP